MNRFSNRGTRTAGLAGAIAGLLTVSCDRIGRTPAPAPPESSPAASPAQTPGEAPPPTDRTPEARHPGSHRDARYWHQRYTELRDKHRSEFVPPELLAATHLVLRSGSKQEGVLLGLTETNLILGLDRGSVEVPREIVSSKSRARFFLEDYAHAQAMNTVVAERRMDEAQQDRVARETVRAKPARDNPRRANAPPPELEPESEPVFAYTPPAGYEAGPPVNSPGDSSVWQVRSYLEQTLRNPGSIQYLEWSRVMQSEREYRVVCRYRANAGDFGLVTEKKVFFMDEMGRVTAVSAVRKNL
jgi:hypothetical protein